MKLEAIGKGFTYRWPGGEVRLEPGKPVDLPTDRAARLLKKAEGRVRQVEIDDPVVIESAHPQAKPVYFERADGVIYGPAKVTDLSKTGTGASERYWVIVKLQGRVSWVRSDRLRSKQAFETQPKVRTVEPIKEPR